jgi:ubiquinol-cytochrome c reductase cytochrome b subunit
VARDLGIPEDLYQANLMFDPSIKIGALMDNAMDKANAKVWFGATPPDLTLVSRARQPEWLYTYLRTFYKDDSRPYGVNNRVFPEVGMPHVLMELQGMPECAPGATSGDASMDQPCASLEIAAAGAMTGEEYDAAIYDLVNFLAYTAEPMKLERQRIGIRVMLFLVIFFVFAWLLSREYWKDVH